MFLECVCKYKHVIEIHMHRSTKSFAEYVRNKALERGWCVAVTLLHNSTNERAEGSRKGRLVDVLVDDSSLLICVRHIELRALSRPSDVATNLLLVRERCNVPDRVVIPLTEVNYGT